MSIIPTILAVGIYVGSGLLILAALVVCAVAVAMILGADSTQEDVQAGKRLLTLSPIFALTVFFLANLALRVFF